MRLQDSFKNRGNRAEAPGMTGLREPHDVGAEALAGGERSRATASKVVPLRRATLDRGAPFAATLALIVLIAALPRVLDALSNPLIFDEIYALHLARLGLSGLLETLSRDVDQPLHFIVVWAWRALGGEGDLWIKVPALVFSLGTIVLVGSMGRAMFGAVPGLVAAAMLALQPAHILYSQQARFHAMEWLCLTSIAWLGWRWVERPTHRGGIAIALLTAAAFYTDWFTAIVIGAVGGWGVFALRRDPRRLALWLVWFAVGVALYSPQLATLAAQIRRDIAGERLLPPMSVSDVSELLRKLAYNASYLVIPIVALVVVPLVRRATRHAAAMLWAVALVVVLLPWGLSVAGIHLFITRQMLIVMPIVSLLLGASIVAVKPAWARALAALVLIGVAARACTMRHPLEETRDLPRAVAALRAANLDDALIVGCETRALLFVKHYLPRADARLLVMPNAEHFHYSDGVLIFPEESFVTPEAFRELAVHGRWAGVRLEHAGRDGRQAADFLDRMGAGATRFGRVTVWKQPATHALETSAPPPLAH